MFVDVVYACSEMVEYVLRYLIAKSQCLNCDSVTKVLSLNYYQPTASLGKWCSVTLKFRITFNSLYCNLIMMVVVDANECNFCVEFSCFHTCFGLVVLLISNYTKSE